MVGGVYIYGDGRQPYQHGLGAQVFFTSRGIQNHYLRYDGPGLLGPLRVEARFEYKRELSSPFYGAGNRSASGFTGNEKDAGTTTTRARRARGCGCAGSRGARTIRSRCTRAIRGGTRGCRPTRRRCWRRCNRWASRADPRDRFCSERCGTHGTASRIRPTGGAEELALRLSGHTTGSRYQYAGVTLSERRYFRLGSRFIFAQRVSLDMLFGEVPFFEWSTTGGVNFTEGVGGMSSVRGIERNRFVGNIKVFSNTELRFHALDMRILGQPMKLGMVAFLDLGRVWHPGVTDGAWHEWHPGAGAGLRVTRRAAVIRVDYALSTETGGQRFYMNYGHMF